MIWVILIGGVIKVVKIVDCNICEEVMCVILCKFVLWEDYERNYCFWVLVGGDDLYKCCCFGDIEFWRVIKDYI